LTRKTKNRHDAKTANLGEPDVCASSHRRDRARGLVMSFNSKSVAAFDVSSFPSFLGVLGGVAVRSPLMFEDRAR
jgi:hypothetical protein